MRQPSLQIQTFQLRLCLNKAVYFSDFQLQVDQTCFIDHFKRDVRIHDITLS